MNDAVVEPTVEPPAGPAVIVIVGRAVSMIQLRATVGPVPMVSRP